MIKHPWMKRFFITAVILLVAAFSLSAQQFPKIVFDKQEFDFGLVSRDSCQVSCVFTYKNTGDTDLYIISVSYGCPCLSAEYSKKGVKPGKTGEVKVIFNGAAQNLGDFRKTVYFTTNTENKYVRIFVKGVMTDAPVRKSGFPML